MPAASTSLRRVRPVGRSDPLELIAGGRLELVLIEAGKLLYFFAGQIGRHCPTVHPCVAHRQEKMLGHEPAAGVDDDVAGFARQDIDDKSLNVTEFFAAGRCDGGAVELLT